MMRSMYTAVSGLRTHQGKMDVIGNNIANVNTVGFKRGQVTFKDTFSQMMTGPSGPHGGKGGTNPQQVGMGVTLGSIANIHTIGSGQTTDNPTDLMINGEGFFTVSDDVNFNNRYYTRAGNFSLDAAGNLVTADGMKVLGYGVRRGESGDYVIDESSIKGIRINQSDTVPASYSTNIEFRGNLDSNTPNGAVHTIDTEIHDSLGNVYKISFDMVKPEGQPDGDKNTTWKLTPKRVTEIATGNYTEDLDGILDVDEIDITFDPRGQVLKINDALVGEGDGFDKVAIKGDELGSIEFNLSKDGETVDNPRGPLGDFSPEIVMFDPDIESTYNRITQYANETDIKPYEAGGNTSGTLDGFTIGGDGIVEGRFTNGETRPLGQLVLTKFDNPMGLQKIGNNYFVPSRNSGEPQSGTAGTRGFGGIDGGTLEMSNVDIAYEFTEMITTQRGFQANSRVITVSDEMLQELVNIKR